MKKMAEGSATVELSLLIPIILFAVLASIYLVMHVHNRAYLEAAAVTEAVGGGMEEPELLFSEPPERSFADSDKRRRVEYRSRTAFPFFEASVWEIEEEAVYEKVRPLKVIRNAKALRTLTGKGES